MKWLATFAVWLTLTSLASAFDEAELEIFDLVEEVNGNFYEYLGLESKASQAELRKAYRGLSLQLHPDKNPAEDAEVRFRWLVAIYDILKDKEKRAIYDNVLENGLPDWRQPVYYYRRMRKLGLAECLVYVVLILTVCQYFVNWAAYYERKWTLSEALQAHAKKLGRKVKKKDKDRADAEISSSMEEEELRLLGPRPTCYDTLPFQSYHAAKYLILALPTLPQTIREAYQARQEAKAEALRLQREEEEEQERYEEARRERRERAKKRRHANGHFIDRTGEASADNARVNGSVASKAKEEEAHKRPANAGKTWTDQDLARLTKLMKKFPPGTPDRWDKIAEVMERTPAEVTKMAGKVKEVSYQIPISKSSQGVTGLESKKLISDDVMEQNGDVSDDDDDDSSEDSDSDDYVPYTVASKDDYVPAAVKEKKKTKGGKLGLDDAAPANGDATPNGAPANGDAAAAAGDEWTQQQQKVLELALAQYPKGTSERWERVAAKVPGKTKEQCMVRFKQLAEIVKRRKEAATASS